MTISQTTRMYEVLVRWGEDGTVSAHQAQITEVIDDSTTPPTILSATVGLPTSLSAADVASVVGTALPALQAQLDAANATITSVQGQLSAAQASAAAAATTAAQQLAAMTADRDAQQAQVASVQQQLDAANAQIATLTAPPAVPSVRMTQFKLALLATPSFANPGKTLLDDANALVASSPANVQLLWSDSVVSRDNPVLNQMAALLVPAPNDPGKALDQLFALAKSQTA